MKELLFIVVVGILQGIIVFPAMRSYEIRSTFHTTRNLYKIIIAHMLQQYD